MTHEDFDGVGVRALSIADIIEKHRDPNDPWRLALVQRHEVWDDLRTARLLDSLLAGYPIGALLVCRVRERSHVLEETVDGRQARVAGPGQWQLLDGQQRVNALLSLFTRRGRHGHFLLDMTAPRDSGGLGARRRDRRESTRYIQWIEGAASPSSLETRGRWVDLSFWEKWAAARVGSFDGLAALVSADHEHAIKLLCELDPDFDPDVDPAQRRQVCERFARLLQLWDRPSIPVQYLELDSPADVLQVFSRVNLEGVRVDAEDVFFAGVKTLWPEVEEHLQRVLGRSEAGARNPLLDRSSALRLLARLGSYATGRGDLLPLDVGRLEGDRGKDFVRCLEKIVAPGSVVVERMLAVASALTDRSVLGHGLVEVPASLLDHVFGWAAVHPRAADPGFVQEELGALDAYLAGATVFRYPTVFQTTFLRRAFREALAAGGAGFGFPTDRILEMTRASWPEGRSGMRAVKGVATEDEQLELVNANFELLLSMVQELPYQLPERAPARAAGEIREVEWDHIWPQARANLMNEREPNGRSHHHPHRVCVGWAGNLWALDRPINNAARDAWPSHKLAWLRDLPKDPLPSLWPPQGFLSDEERELLLDAERGLTAKPQRFEEGMRAFHQFARGRTLRIFQAVSSRIPDLEKFAPQPGSRAADLDEPALGDVAGALNIQLERPATTTGESELGVSEDRFARVFEFAQRAGVEEELRSVIAVARELDLHVRPYVVSVMVAPPAHRGRMLFTVTPEEKGGGSFILYVSPSAFSQFFPEATEARVRAAFGPDDVRELRSSAVPEFIESLRGLLPSAGQRMAGS